MSNLINLTSQLSKLSQEYIEAQQEEKRLTDLYEIMEQKYNDGDESITDSMMDEAYEKMNDALDRVDSISDQIADIEEEIDELNNQHDYKDGEEW